jgi:hypothetical protein
MDHQAYRGFEPGIGAPGGRTWIENPRRPVPIVESRHRTPEPMSRRIGRDEADYCRARAATEAGRADEAAHPAARAAHREMAALYRERALAARQIGISEIQDWTSEGGSWLPDE